MSTKWKGILETLRTEGFASPWKSSSDECNKLLQGLIRTMSKQDEMHFEPNHMAPYVGYGPHKNAKGQDLPDYSDTNKVQICEELGSVEKVIDDSMSHIFCLMNNPLHPLFMANVIPPTTLPAILTSTIANKLHANLLNEHYSQNVAKTELELYSMISHLLPIGNGEHQWPKPWAPPKPDGSSHFHVIGIPRDGDGSGGIMTFGGTGCYFYGVKYALTKVANSVLNATQTVRATGIQPGKFVILVSNQGHYCCSNITDWCGIGYNNVIKVCTNEDNTMDLNNLKVKLAEAKKAGKTVVAVVPTVGTTDANSMDDVPGIRAIINDFENCVDAETNKRYDKPLIYADSVIGWVWLFFRDYDFEKNPLNFDPESLKQIKRNAEIVSGVVDADAFSVDYHKTGFSCYPASMVMLKDYGCFATLMSRDAPAYLQQEQYDPAMYTLETSRTSVGSVSSWTTLKYLGKDGFRVLAYNLLARQNYLRKKLLETGFVAICNEHNHFYSTIFRVYPYPYTQDDYYKEMRNESVYEEVFKACNEFQKAIYSRLYENLRKNDGSTECLSTPNIGLTTGFRYSYYNPDGDKLEPDGKTRMQGVFALKCFINGPFIDDTHVDIVVNHIVKVRDEVLHRLLKKGTHDDKQPNISRAIVKAVLPPGVHMYNNLIPPMSIPIDFLLPPNVPHDSQAVSEERTRLKHHVKVTDRKLRDIQRHLIFGTKSPAETDNSDSLTDL